MQLSDIGNLPPHNCLRLNILNKGIPRVKFKTLQKLDEHLGQSPRAGEVGGGQSRLANRSTDKKLFSTASLGAGASELNSLGESEE